MCLTVGDINKTVRASSTMMLDFIAKNGISNKHLILKEEWFLCPTEKNATVLLLCSGLNFTLF